MKTANEMYEYIVKNKLGNGYAKRAYLKHFKLIEDSLIGDEEVIYCFMGLEDLVVDHAYAVTSSGVLLAGRKKLFKYRMDLVPIKDIKSIEKDKGKGYGIIIIDTDYDRKVIGIIENESKEVYKSLKEIIESMQSVEEGVI